MTSVRSIAVLLLLLAGPSAASAKQDAPQTPPPSHRIRYEIRYLNVHAAEVLAWDQCVRKEACRVAALANGNGRGAVMEVDADPATQERIARALAERDMPRTQSFQLVLLGAGNKPNGPSPTLSPGAQKALADIQGFLPFKHYRLLDVALVRVNQEDVAQAQVAGLGAYPYNLALRFRAGGEDGKKLFIDGFNLEDEKDNNLIQTTFVMDAGETVVVGTSSVPTLEEALVAILTALP